MHSLGINRVEMHLRAILIRHDSSTTCMQNIGLNKCMHNYKRRIWRLRTDCHLSRTFSREHTEAQQKQNFCSEASRTVGEPHQHKDREEHNTASRFGCKHNKFSDSIAHQKPMIYYVKVDIVRYPAADLFSRTIITSLDTDAGFWPRPGS